MLYHRVTRTCGAVPFGVLDGYPGNFPHWCNRVNQGTREGPQPKPRAFPLRAAGPTLHPIPGSVTVTTCRPHS